MNPNALPLDLQAQLQSLLAQNQANSYPPPRSVQPLRQEHQQPQSHQHRQQSHPQPRRHQQHSSHQPQSHDHYQRQQRVSRSGPDPNAHAAWLEHSRINAHTDINTPTASDDHMSGGSSNYEAGSVSGADGSNGSSMARDPGACERGSTKLQVPFFRWFGPTAYTPGFKRIRVEVQEESDTPDNEPAAASASTTTHALPPFAPSRPLSSFPYDSAPFTTQRPLSSPHSYSGRSSPSPGSTSSASLAHSSPDGNGRSRSQDLRRKREAELEEYRNACFKSKKQTEPTDELFEHLLEVFWRDLGCHFPFMNRAQILDQHRTHTLPALLANSICACASRFSSHPLLLRLRSDPTRLWEAAIPFEDSAKKLLVPVLSFPSEETAVALVLLAWNEFGSGRDSGMWMYVGMAIRMIQDLGMSHEASIVRQASAFEIARKRLLFWSVFFLDRVTCYGTGRAVTLAESDIDVLLPSQADCELVSPTISLPTTSANVNLPPPNPWPALIMIVVHRGRISDCLNKPGGGATERASRQRLESMQANLIHYYSNMPPALQFSVQTFKMYRDLQLSPSFLLLHLLFHSVITVLHRPSILQLFGPDDQVLMETNVEVSRSSARTLANMLSYADSAGPIAVLANPMADQAIFICAIAFLDERSTLEVSRRLDLSNLSMTSSRTTTTKPSGSGSKTPTSMKVLRSFTTSKVTVSTSALKNLISRWAGVGWVLRTIDQKQRGLLAEEVDPDFNNEGQDGAGEHAVPVLFPRDPALIQAWLRREWNESNGNGSPTSSQGDTQAAMAAFIQSSAAAAAGQHQSTPGGSEAGGAHWPPLGQDGFDAQMFLEQLPSDVGLSFTGQSLDASTGLTMSLDAPDFSTFVNANGSLEASGFPLSSSGSSLASTSHASVPSSSQQPPFLFDGIDQAMLDTLAFDENGLPSESFFSDVVWGGGQVLD